MSVTLLFGDAHFQNPTFDFATDKILKRLFIEQIWPIARERKVKRVVQVGDFTNDKKQINKQTSHIINECFTKPAIDLGLEVILICGNHDAYFRDRNEVNSLHSLFERTGFKIVDTEVLKQGNSVYIPWGFNPKQYPAQYAFGHFEINGFEYQKGVVSNKGNRIDEFDFFDFAYVGHFHRKSIKKNIMYLGSLIALDFGETDTEHGFYLFDDETGKIEFIKSNFELFKKINYPDDCEKVKDYDFSDKAVSIIVTKKEDENVYKQFLDSIYKQSPIAVKILSLEGELQKIMELDQVDGVENILALSKRYIEKMELQKSIENKTLYEVFERTYQEAMI